MTELEKAMVRLAEAEFMLKAWQSVELVAVSPGDREDAALAWRHTEWALAQNVAEAAKAVERIKEQS